MADAGDPTHLKVFPFTLQSVRSSNLLNFPHTTECAKKNFNLHVNKKQNTP